MFTGIIECVGQVQAVREQAGGRRLAICAPAYWDGLAAGASVAVDGVCLTLVRADERVGEFDVVPETLRRTTLGDVCAGARVNLERAMRADGRLDGHFVQGHVDALATIARIDESSAESRRCFAIEEAAVRYVIPKGSIAIDGISLTVASVAGREFCVALIPATLQRTTLGRKPVGARVNVETDLLARTIVHRLESLRGPESRVTADLLKQHGFA